MAPRVPPAAPAVVARPAPAPTASASANVDDARLRDLHTRLQQAKLQTKEANVSFEGLAKSIRATEAKLREQHKNRKIDFDVVINPRKLWQFFVEPVRCSLHNPCFLRKSNAPAGCHNGGITPKLKQQSYSDLVRRFLVMLF